ncbi:citramalate synthase [Effusibacillus consociatus]|uniref:Citramalate synthase n=1 Tax=Effusibacillus consociatus TaxID=1117041 RepID=A0ABV9Q5T0_9BACL
MEKVLIYDTTLRDGTQGEGISLSVEDKLKIALRLDQFGVHYIEGGWPGSNPKDMEFFQKVKELPLKTAKITAFGSTRRQGISADQDENLQKLLESGVSVVAIFGKTWDFQVTHALNSTLEENLSMIYDSVKFLKSHGLEVIFDAEHFFDGYKANSTYALETLKKAEEGGADWIVLCDTNGGTLPHEIGEIVAVVKQKLTTPIGVHCHNDSECAVANSIAAVREGARQVQGTMNGYGERCGNANLISIIPNLQLKLGYSCVREEQISLLTSLSRYVHEIANVAPPNNQPFTGMSAFAHKGGMHVSAILKSPETYEHMAPERVGNQRRVLVSELSGQSNLLYKAQELNMDLDKSNPVNKRILQKLKKMEHEGYQYEGAEASFELLVREELGEVKEFFTLESFKILVETEDSAVNTMAIVKLRVFDEVVHAAAEGNGPVNAFDNALRKALESFYPEIREMHLSDYKVRVLDEGGATAAKVRVLVESSNGKEQWNTVGVSTNIIEASWQSLFDSIRYFLLMKNELKVNAR